MTPPAKLPWTELLLLWLAGLYLRLTVLVAPPLAPMIAADLDLGAAGLGALTTVPVLMLSLVAIPAAWVIARAGAGAAVVGCLAIIALASSARGLAHDPLPLFAATAIMGAAIAVLQPALPALLHQWTPARLGLGTAVYMNGMLLGEIFSAGLTLPVVLPAAGGDWRVALLIWSLPALAVAIAIARRSRHHPRHTRDEGPWLPPLASPRLWRMGLLLGATGALFFGTNAYMGAVLEARDETDLLGAGLIVMNGGQVAAAMVMLRLTGRLSGHRNAFLTASVLALLGLAGFLLLDGAIALAAAFSVGLFTGVTLILLVALPPRLAGRGATAPLAAGMFMIGYAIAFLVPTGGGLLAEVTGDARTTLLPAFLYALAVLPLIGGLLPLADEQAPAA